jgi:hypothetical protein
MTYKLLNDGAGVLRSSDNAFVPADSQNRDWQIFQAWLQVGNTPTPADPPAPPDPAAERQSHYPAAWLYLEALYLARHGNPAPLAALDLKIAAVMQQFPSPP